MFVNRSGERFEAVVAGYDRRNDLAVVDVGADVPALEWAVDHGHEPEVGDLVVACDKIVTDC